LWNTLISSNLANSPGELGAFQKLPDELEKPFREIWTRNADVLSILYTGTNALKTDFTRTGKRTKKGALEDGKNSLTRYVKNNFYDGYNQNCIDLILGKLDAKQVTTAKKSVNSAIYLGFVVFSLPLILKYILDTLDQELFKGHSKTKSVIFYVTVFSLSIFMVLKAVQSNAKKFIEKPILHH